MREIKFRGMSIKGEWSEGLLCIDKDGWFISNSAGMPKAFHVRPETVGQFTGLKDKEGKDIYEGDTFRISLAHTSGVGWDERLAAWYYGGLRLTKSKAAQYKVVGNRFEGVLEEDGDTK